MPAARVKVRKEILLECQMIRFCGLPVLVATPMATSSALRRFFLDLAGPLMFEADGEAVSAGAFVIEVRKVLAANEPMAIYPAGGWGAMAAVCREVIELNGGEVRLRRKAARLASDGVRVLGMWLDVGFVAARVGVPELIGK